MSTQWQWAPLMTRLLSLNAISDKKKPELLGKMTYTSSEAGKAQKNLRYLEKPENKEATKDYWGHLEKSGGANMQVIPMEQR